jgi:hypothetical protein
VSQKKEYYQCEQVEEIKKLTVNSALLANDIKNILSGLELIKDSLDLKIDSLNEKVELLNSSVIERLKPYDEHLDGAKKRADLITGIIISILSVAGGCIWWGATINTKVESHLTTGDNHGHVAVSASTRESQAVL